MSTDITDACDVWDRCGEWSDGADGFVSVEVSPLVAHERMPRWLRPANGTSGVDRPNLLVKVPATIAGVEAIRRLTAEGISINVTLIFSIARYGQVIEAYQKGLAEYGDAGGRLKTINSVASFFVSRIDTEVDKRLEAMRHRSTSGERRRLPMLASLTNSSSSGPNR